MKPLLITLFALHALCACSKAAHICDNKGQPTINLFALLFQLALCIWIAMVLW